MVFLSKLLVRLWSGFLLAIFLAVSILGILAIALIPTFRGIGVGLLVFGIVGLAIAVAGLAGAGFDKDNADDSHGNIKAAALVIFFAVMSILHILFLIFGVALIAVSPTAGLLPSSLEHDSFSKIFDALPGGWGSAADKIIKIEHFAIGLGCVMIVIAAIILVTCIASAIQMGKKLFARFFIVSFSIIEVIIGLALAIFLLIINSSHDGLLAGYVDQVGKGIIVPIVIFGFILAIVGFIGIATCLIGQKYKVLSVVFQIGNILALSAFIVLFILCIVFHAMILGWSDKLCDGDDCAASVQLYIDNICPDESCYDEDQLIKRIRHVAQGFATILLFVCMYLVIFLIIVVASTCYLCRQPEDAVEPSEKLSGKFDYY